MGLVRTVDPIADPVTLAELKAHSRIPHDDDDAQMTGFIRAATRRLDGREGLLSRSLTTQTWRLTLDCFPACIRLPLPPHQSVTSITYRDPAGVLQTLDPSLYDVFGIGDDAGAFILPRDVSWPRTRTRPESVAVTFVAGYPWSEDSPPVASTPEPIKQAILMLAAHYYEHREAAIMGSGFFMETPEGFDDLVMGYRVFEL